MLARYSMLPFGRLLHEITQVRRRRSRNKLTQLPLSTLHKSCDLSILPTNSNRLQKVPFRHTPNYNMAGLHNIRKRASHAKQTQKSVTKGMSSSYISEKATLETSVTKLRKALKELEQDRDAWHSALKAERSIAGILASSVDETDSGRVLKAGVAKLDQANDNLAQVHDKSFKENVDKVTKYVAEMEAVLKTMREVEGLLAEKGRYEKKVEKLVDRGQKETEEKRKGKVGRNIDKLKKARENFENGEKNVVEKAKEVNQEFVKAVEYLAKAFWGRRNGVLKEFEEGSKELRMWAVGEEMKEEVKEEA